jgi:glycosyltransferase involved in cell wall biosynthesis
MYILKQKRNLENPIPKKIKILQIISGDLWAGAEAMAFQLLSGLLKEKNIDLFVLLLNQGKLLQKCYLEGTKTYLIDENINSFPKILYKSIDLSIKIKPDIVHAHRYKENILAAMIQPFCGMPLLISTQHGRKEVEGKTSYFQRIISCTNRISLIWRFKKIVAVSEDTKNYLLTEKRINIKKIKSIHNGIDPCYYRAQKKKSNIANIKIGSAGRLFPVKNYLQMIDIAVDVIKYRKNVEFILAGDGPERNAIKRRIKRFGIEKQVKLLGHIDDMNTFYGEIDIYINTSLHEGSPMTILEAMASGRPVLAFHTAGLKEIISNGLDGYTVPAGSTKLFAAKIVSLIDDQKMIAKMGYEARKKIEDKYASKHMAKKYVTLYEKIVQDR